MKPNTKAVKEAPALTQLAASVPTLDKEGMHADDIVLQDSAWEVSTDEPDRTIYHKAGGTLTLTASQADDNPHRVNWELGVCVNGTQIGYAAKIMRPGDLNTKAVAELIREAIKGGEEEFKKWSDALAEARRQLEA